jgi:hypothetical protein
LVPGRQGQNDPSTADRGRFSQRETSSPSVSGMIPGLSPIPVSASLPSCSNLVVLSQEDTVEPSLPFSFPPSLVAQTSSTNPLVGSGFLGGHGLDAATVPCCSGFVPPPLTRAAEMGERIHSSLPVLQPFKPFQCNYQKARDFREGQVKWNDGLLADSMEASKKTGGFCNKASVVEPYSKEDSASPPLKSSADTTSYEKKVVSNGKKGFLRKGFLNRRPSVLAPSTNSSLPSE